jgi:pyruvate dehydrogenase E2 component (dihydrolipoamide acetyltransferase)
MATVIRMPSVLAGATEAALANWLVKPGDAVSVGTPLAEIETEKALVEYAAEEAGIVGRLVLAAGDSGEIGDPIAVLVAPGETDAEVDTALGVVASAPSGPAAQPTAPAISAPLTPPISLPSPPNSPPTPPSSPPSPPNSPPSPPNSPPSPPNSPPSGSIAQRGPIEGAVSANDSSAVAAGAAGGRVFASPLVRKLAGQQGVDLGAIAGTGPNGRIVRRDLERWLAAGATSALAPSAPSAASAAESVSAVAGDAEHGTVRDDALVTLVPHTPMRRAIARRLTESKATTPHFYMVAECVVDELLAMRARVNEASGVKVSVNDFVIMAAAAAFRDVPEANLIWSDEGLLAYSSVDISIAVATEGGLVTPVLRGVDRLRLSEIARQAADLAERARNRRLKQHELEGGTFSVSNLGMYGTVEFSAIINPPQSGILAVGAARKQPVVAADGSIAVATVMRCTLSVDHRAIDGALAARWLAAFTTRLENPLGAII